MFNTILKNSGAEFPVKVGSNEEVRLYASRLVNGECQLLITYCGQLYLTRGDSTYVTISGSGIDQRLDELKLEISKLDKKSDLNFESLSTSLADIESGNLEKFELINIVIKNNEDKINELDKKMIESVDKIGQELTTRIEEINTSLTSSIDEIKNILNNGKRSIVDAINNRDINSNADVLNTFDELAVLINNIK